MTTISKNLPVRLTPANMHELVMRDDFSPGVLSRLSERQKAKLRRFIRARLPLCQPQQRKTLSARLAMLNPDADARLDSWEYHHANVCTAIQGYLQENAAMPTQAVLAAKTGYSRQTISKHLKAYREHPSYTEQVETMRLMKMKVTEKMLAMALQGDVRAAKVFLDTAAKAESRKVQAGLVQPGAAQLVQNNFIRINGLFITEEKLKGLQPAQLAQLESLLNPQEEVHEMETILNAEDQNDGTVQTVPGSQNDTIAYTDVMANPFGTSR